MYHRVSGGHGRRQCTGTEEAHQHRRQLHIHKDVGQDLIGLCRHRLEEHSGEADEEERQQKHLKRRIEHHRSSDRAGILGRKRLHEQVRPDRESDSRHQDSRGVLAPAPAAALGVQSWRRQ